MKVREFLTLEFAGAIIGMLLGIQLGVAILTLGAPRVIPVFPMQGYPDIRHSY